MRWLEGLGLRVRCRVGSQWVGSSGWRNQVRWRRAYWRVRMVVRSMASDNVEAGAVEDHRASVSGVADAGQGREGAVVRALIA